MKVYRVEDDEHIGPFRSKKGDHFRSKGINYYDGLHHVPEMFWDKFFFGMPICSEKEQIYFKSLIIGCGTLWQIRHWFTYDDLISLHAKGFRIYAYDVPDEDIAEIERYQIIYKKQSYHSREKVRISEVYKEVA